MMGSVTLVGERHAEPGQAFVYEGAASGCEGCPYRDQCLNLEVGQPYEITAVRDGAQLLPCAVHEDDVVAVEVEPITFRTNIASRHAFAGNKVELPGDCPHIECPSHHLCVPAAGSFDASYRVVDVEGEPPHETCLLERDLTAVEVAYEAE